MPYYDNFWHKDAQENSPSPYLFGSLCKIEN